MQFVSLKSAICQTFASAAASGRPLGRRITFLTSAGSVTGIPVLSKSEAQDKEVNAYQNLLSDADAAFEEAWRRTGQSRAPHDGYILLRDVEIRSFGDAVVMKDPAFVLFTQSICGVLLDSEEPK